MSRVGSGENACLAVRAGAVRQRGRINSKTGQGKRNKSLLSRGIKGKKTQSLRSDKKEKKTEK